MTNIKRLGKILVIFSLFIMLTLSTTNGTTEYTISSSDINIPGIFHEIEVLEEEFSNNQIHDEQLFLVFFEHKSHYVDFLNNYDSELNFDGLMGTVVKTDLNGIYSLMNENSYLSFNNINPISNEKHKFIPHSSVSAINPSVQSLSSAAVIGVDKLWELGYRGEGSTIGIFDEGINASHPDFSFANGTSRIKNAAGFINTIYGNENNLTNTGGSHGTLVAGIAAGGGILTPSNQGMANESWLLDIDLDEGPEDYLDFTILGEIAAINWAIENGVDVINRSYGISDGEGAYWDTILFPDMQARYATIRQATKQGVIFVHSAGNEGGGYYTISPDNYVHEITVGATDAGMDSMAPYSSRGPIWRTNAISHDVIAPGTE
ncbi:MAG: S8 family peptidase, partial [Candidatus Hodarchaeales archaeon]